jgi:hypothetical protein
MPTDMQKPAVGVPFIDPVFKTKVTRISDAQALSKPGVFPYYSKRQAWNCDESLLIVLSDDGGSLLFDGSSYKFVKPLDDVGGEDVFWDRANPSLILFNPGHELWAYDVRTDEKYLVFDFAGYEFANTCGEGNLSRDGAWYAVVASTYNETTGEVRREKLMVVALTLDGGEIGGRIAATLDLPDSLGDFDWVSVSPSGEYIVVDYADTETGRFHGVEVYDRSFNPLWQKPLGAGHSDLGIDANGDEVLVMDVYDSESNQTDYVKYRLADGSATKLLTVDWSFYQHFSLRAFGLPGWVLVSTFDGPGRLSDGPTDWLPFEDEVFFLKLDGSGEVKGVAHHHSCRYSEATPDADNSVYWAEPHASASANGDRVVFASNWREGLDKVESVETYVADLR